MLHTFNHRMLRALAINENDRTRMLEIARNIVSEFRLIVFVVHDPEKHAGIEKVAKRYFNRFNYFKKSRLLCFMLSEPPEMWLNTNNFFLKKAKHSTYAKNDYESSALSISTLLNIPPTKLPYIVITTSFESEKFTWLEISNESLESTLKELEAKISNSNKSYNVEYLNNTLDLNANIASAIYESIPVSNFDANSIYSENQLANIIASQNIKIHSARTHLAAYDAELNEESDIFERLCINNAINISRKNITRPTERIHYRPDNNPSINISHRRTNPISRSRSTPTSDIDDKSDMGPRCMMLIPLDPTEALHTLVDPPETLLTLANNNLLEDDSKIMLRTAERVYDIFKSEIDVDYTPAAICYAKVFENEINFSIVHWAREKLGIQLPQYFNRWQSDIQATYTPNIAGGHPINLNKGSESRWSPPPMGQSELVCNGLSKDLEIPPELTDDQWKTLMKAWTIIRRNRNEASHSNLMTKNKMLEIRDSLILLAENGIFETLNAIKNRMRLHPK